MGWFFGKNKKKDKDVSVVIELEKADIYSQPPPTKKTPNNIRRNDRRIKSLLALADRYSKDSTEWKRVNKELRKRELLKKFWEEGDE